MMEDELKIEGTRVKEVDKLFRMDINTVLVYRLVN